LRTHLFLVEDGFTSRVHLAELGDIVDLCVDDDPKVTLLLVLED